MVAITEETKISVSAKDVFSFLVNIDTLYKTWHPESHIFCKVLIGTLTKKGCWFHFLEFINGFPIYTTAKITAVIDNEYIEYRNTFPFSVLISGKAYFKIEKITDSQTKLIAYVEYGNKYFDSIANFFVKPTVVRNHMVEEGENLKKYLEFKDKD